MSSQKQLENKELLAPGSKMQSRMEGKTGWREGCSQEAERDECSSHSPFSLKFIILLFVCMCVCVCVSGYVHVHVPEDVRRLSDPLGLGLQVVSHLPQVLRLNLESAAGIIHTSNH
jgi:hypothetical protein